MASVTVPIVTKYSRPAGNTPFTARVLNIMRDLVMKYVADPDILDLSNRLTTINNPAKTLARDFAFLKARIAYVPDPPGIEYIASPRRTIVYGEPGDCDDMSVAAGALLRSQGFPVAFRAIAYRVPEFTHVYTMVRISGKWIPFDLTLNQLGIQRPHHKEMNLILP